MTESGIVRAKLLKLNAGVVFQNDKEVVVVYNQKGKTKLASFELKGYYHDRYGPNVLATFNGFRFWFKSGDVADAVSDSQMAGMKDKFDGESDLPQFDPTILGDLKS
jgi:hypothetical protein